MKEPVKSCFTLDPFQKEAINSLKEGHSVVVSAPTGSGKTLIGEFVIEEALKGKERVFYTTPLKALSNQKFHDFQKKYGENKVGILTGDTAINRDAQIIVMTTEIYRNMLYGTILGAVDENLKRLKYLVLDECHYMNDPERGTVWEECIIYSPPAVQILALSATIANAKELTEWISNVHGDTKLIESFDRPVPLRFYFAKEYGLVPLLTTNGKLNPNLKEHRDSFKARRQQFRDAKRLNHLKTISVPELVKNTHDKGFLPAIYFVFSRRGCELALKDCQRLGHSLLTVEERKTLEKLIRERIYGNEYLLKHKYLDPLYQGMSVHHAGLLPQWKAIVEELFSKGLIKVVFATGTLAAGINMPAKTTVISNLGKRGDEGHKTLTSNEFLQMSGRAGRRGMDTVGNVVIKETFDHSASTAAKLATSLPDPLVSQFTPNYSMALNLLQNHSMEEIKILLNKCFGQYLINKTLGSYLKDKESLEKNLLENINNYKTEGKARKIENKLKEINKFIAEQEHFYWNRFLKICRVLTKLGYLKNNIPTDTGIIASSLRGENIILISEILLHCDFVGAHHGTPLRPEEFSALMSCLAIDGVRPRTYSKAYPSSNVSKTIFSMEKVVRNLIKVQRDEGLEITTNITPNLSGLIQLWCNPDTKWIDLLRQTNLDDGDIVRGARRTMDLLRHIKNAPHVKPQITELAKYAFELMDKEPVREVV